jgi:hypothetical protein
MVAVAEPGLCRVRLIGGGDGTSTGAFVALPHESEPDEVSAPATTLDELLATAHRLGLKVLIDQVWSHTAAEHPWFLESRTSRTNPKADWYVWADARPDGRPPNNWQSWISCCSFRVPVPYHPQEG